MVLRWIMVAAILIADLYAIYNELRLLRQFVRARRTNTIINETLSHALMTWTVLSLAAFLVTVVSFMYLIRRYGWPM